MGKIIRKLTIREAIGGKGEILKAAQSGRKAEDAKTGDPVQILQVIGRCTGYVPGESDNGPYVKLKGEFQGVNLLTGEVIENIATAILPNFVGDLVAGAVQSGAESVDFAVVISVNYNEDAATMYEFTAESLLPPQQSKAIAGILGQLQAAGVALPAPAKLAALAAPAPAAAPAAAPAPAETPAAVPAAKGKEKAKV